MVKRFDANAEIMKKGCTNLGLPAGSDTTDEEIGNMYWAIKNAAKATRVDHRFILAVIMQESLGCVRVYTTRVTHASPGLMVSNFLASRSDLSKSTNSNFDCAGVI